MTKKVITLSGTEAIQIGGYVDESGNRCVSLSVEMDNGAHNIITCAAPLLNAYAEHLAKAAQHLSNEDYWGTAPKS
ncbi:hypothetical protein [Sphingobium yanoikuyae]|uniref:hypothetical protein n=1 Tax=Sphingobium yanoikuyae TaxID=13690 RepID=UPI0022DE4DB9|nr:hypothetical protein [Sphingobium yanoikuyae]WBQ15019.1 hypothetical protein PAE53_13895 [Sphingobium yanoikuyae]